MNIIEILILVMNCSLMLISLYLLFLYFKCDNFKTYPCYNIIIISLIILIDNFLRIFNTQDSKRIIQYIQAFSLTFLDKLLLTTITSQVFIYYLGVVKSKFYYDYELYIFFLTFFITIGIDISITILYFCILDGITNYKDKNYKGNKYYYIQGNKFKKIVDTIFNSIFLSFNIIFIILLLLFFHKKVKQAKQGLIEDSNIYSKHFWKILLMFIFNTGIFIESYLIIYEKIKIEYIDLIYLTTCLFLDLCYTYNDTIKKETLKIFCKKIYIKKYERHSNRNNSFSNNEVIEDKDYFPYVYY